MCLGAFSSCDMCEQADTASCPTSLEMVPGSSCAWGCNGFPSGSAPRTHCQALLSCLTTMGCMFQSDPTPCLCGALAPAICAAMGAPLTAACATQYAAAAADAPGTVFTQFSDPTSPVGIADNIAQCDVDSACACR